jgi:predicted ATPase/DNA-binding SARP family transcriptional activator
VATAGLSVCLLGPVQCWRDGAAVPLGGARRAGLLAFLASRHPHSVSRAELVDGLWGERSPMTAVNSIQVHVSAVRRAAGPETIVTHGDGYQLAAAAAVDAAAFARDLVRGQAELARGESHEAARSLRKALSRWQGPALSDVRDAPFAAVEAARLEELRLLALTSRIEADLVLGRHHDLVPELQALVAQEPFREGLRIALMRALHRCGRQGEALAAYDEARRLLSRELGTEPSSALRELHQRLLTSPDAEAAGGTQDGLITRVLPNLLDETVGRQADLVAVEKLLASDRARLVTLLGPGGVGKTRLSIEVGHHVRRFYRHGVVFIPLAEAEKPSDVAPTICAALGIPAADDAQEALASALHARQMLLICDNFEHVVEAGAMLTSLLRAAPGVTVLSTSRQPLKIRAEQLYRLAPLAVADPTPGHSPAVELFVLRARAADPAFDPDDPDLRTIGSICDRCDGLPLAIELAAARTHALGPSELLERLGDLLPVLSAGSTDLTQRHRSLRASIAWSFKGVPPPLEHLVPQLSVFRGGFTLDAVQAVTRLDAEQALQCVQTLLDHSLLRRRTVDRDGHRLELPETIREYARDLIGPEELAAVRDRHAAFYRVLMGPPPDPSPAPSTAAGWTAQLLERPNIRAAIRWALRRDDGELAADLVVGAAPMWHTIGPREELAAWLAAVQLRADVSTGRRIDALYATALSRDRAGDVLGLGETLDRARSLATDTADGRRLAWVTAFSAWHATRLGDRPRAEQLAACAASLAEDHPEAIELKAWTLISQGLATSDPIRAISTFEEGLRVARSRRLDVTCLVLLANLTDLCLVGGLSERALRLAEEGISLATLLGAVENAGILHGLRSYAHLQLGYHDAASNDALAGIRHAITLGEAGFGRHSLVFLAAATSAARPDRAAFLLGIADGSRTGVEHPAVHQATERYLAALPDRLGAEYGPAHEAGRQLVAERGLLNALIAALADPSTPPTR